MKNECLKAIRAELSRVGIRDVTQVHGGKHTQVRWAFNGTVRSYTVPGTPGDVRSVRNSRAAIRRLLRADGLIVEEPRPASPPKQPDRLTVLERRVAVLEQAVQSFVAAAPVGPSTKQE